MDTNESRCAEQVSQLRNYALFFIDTSGILQSWNAGVERLFGYTEAEWVGQHASIIFTPADKAADLCQMELAGARTNGAASDIRWHRCKSGKEIFANGVIEAVRDASGEVTGFTKIVSDETERKRLQDSLLELNVALEQFAYAASHDLQEPLRTVRSFAQLLSKNESERLSAEGREYVNFITASVARMSTLVSDVLLYARSGVEKQPLVTISLDDEVEAAASQLTAAIEEAGATVTHDPLPKVTVEHSQMTRLFLNLIGNAIKYRAPDRNPNIHISAIPAGENRVTIAVRDNGVGFEPKFADTIFQPFTRLTRSASSGSGVGLTICRRIAERSGGRIWAESTPGEGSTFFINLPVAGD